MVYNTRTFALAEHYFTNNAIPDVDTSNIPNNIDEAVSTILYETEINYNRLMNISGVFGSGFINEEVITEAVDLKGFFAKVKTFFKNLLEKIAKLFKKIMEKAKEFFKNIFSKNKKSNTNGNNSSTQKNNASVNSKEDDNSSDENNRSSGTKMLGYTDILALPQKEYNDITYKGYNYTHISEGTSKIDTRKIFKVITNQLDSVISDAENRIFELKSDEDIENFYKDSINIYNRLNSSEIKNATQKDIRSVILGQNAYSTDQNTWKEELFKYFRDGQDSPTKLAMTNSDIVKYQEAIRDGEDSIDFRLKHTYNQIKQELEWRLRDFNPIKDREEMYNSTKWKSKVISKYFYETTTFKYYWLKQAITDVTEFTTAQTNAIIEQCAQYKRALTQILNQ